MANVTTEVYLVFADLSEGPVVFTGPWSDAYDYIVAHRTGFGYGMRILV